LGFSPERRIRKRREFLAVQGQGRRVNGKHYRFFVRARQVAPTSPVAGQTRFGITVTRKVGNAVTRNRIKRIVREGCRRAAWLFSPCLDVVIVAHASAASLGARATLSELTELARRLDAGAAR
jgi:ribonuclease P protein component